MAPFNAPTFQRRNLAEEVASHLAMQVVDGHLAPDQPLREQGLVKELNVSRGTLREALLVLERQYLAVITPGKGARVAPLDERWVLEVHAVWYALFELLLVNVSETAAPDRRAQLAQAVEKLDDPELPQGEFVQDAMALVEWICDVHGDGVLTRQLRNLIPAARRCFRYAVFGDPSEIEDTRQFAVSVARAAVEGNGTEVRTQVRAIAAREKQRMLDLLKSPSARAQD